MRVPFCWDMMKARLYIVESATFQHTQVHITDITVYCFSSAKKERYAGTHK
jgi:hypothetical protein